VYVVAAVGVVVDAAEYNQLVAEGDGGVAPAADGFSSECFDCFPAESFEVEHRHLVYVAVPFR
jgi:hypothetical protein